jgi:hypothetical protein
MQNVTQAQINRPKTNSWMSYTIVPINTTSAPSPDGLRGTYTITFYLSIPGKNVFTDQIHTSESIMAGDSLLSISRDINYEFREKNGDILTIKLYKNTEGRFSTAQVSILADNFTNAEHEAYDLIYPLISWFSFQHDAALEIRSQEVLENSTGVRRITIGIIGEVKSFLEIESHIPSTEEFRSLFSTYREALNATSPFYQFLCFYKVIENINCLRSEKKKAIIAKGEQPHQPGEIIPSSVDTNTNIDVDFHSLFKPFLGRKFTFVCEKFRGVLRNAIAHVDPNQIIRLNDRFQDVTECLHAIPVIKYMAREMIRTEIGSDARFQQINPPIV